MIDLKNLKIVDVEFSDCKILNMNLDAKKKTFVLKMEELYLINEEEYIDNITFIGNSFDNYLITKYNSESQKQIASIYLENMHEILEVKLNNDITTFCGFGVQSGDWIEISFKNLVYLFEYS